MARSIAQGHGFSSPFYPSTGPTALVPPLFPYLLAAVFRIFGVYTAASAIAILSINSVFSALTCIPLYFSTRYATGPNAPPPSPHGHGSSIPSPSTFPRRAYGSTPLPASSSPPASASRNAFTTSGAQPRLAGLRSALRRRWPLQPIRALDVSGLPDPHGRRPPSPPKKSGWRNSLVATLGLLAVLAPWTVRNYRALHVLTPVRDNFWLECWAGNDGNTFESNDRWAHPASNPAEMQSFESLGEIRYLAEKHTLADHLHPPASGRLPEILLPPRPLLLDRLLELHPCLSRDQPTQIPDMFFSIGLTIFMLIGARKLWLRDKTAALPYVLLMALFPFTYFLTHASPDYRQPIEPEIIALVSTGILSLRVQPSRPQGQPAI